MILSEAHSAKGGELKIAEQELTLRSAQFKDLQAKYNDSISRVDSYIDVITTQDTKLAYFAII